MNFKETKDKYELIFHRELSDREIAEAVLEKYNDLLSDYNALMEDHDELQADYAKAITELKNTPQMDEKYIEMVEKIKAIMSVPARWHEVNVSIDDDEYRISCHLTGMYEEETESV